ncbi:hypothetical protein GOV07_03575 [Candidatus Woesearchaeota archaeon]|nr:hypothetical protein [Candidatus Woesearchaeota archaeon]
MVMWTLTTILQLVVLFGSAAIAYQARRLYTLSNYRGIKLFGMAFGFAMLSPLLRIVTAKTVVAPIGNFLADYFLVLWSFFLAYSLVWQDLDKKGKKNIALYLLAAVFVVLSTVYDSRAFFYMPFFAAFGYALVHTYTKRRVQLTYVLAISLAFIAILLQFLNSYISNDTFGIVVQILTTLVYIAIVWIVLKGIIRGRRAMRALEQLRRKH